MTVNKFLNFTSPVKDNKPKTFCLWITLQSFLEDIIIMIPFQVSITLPAYWTLLTKIYHTPYFFLTASIVLLVLLSTLLSIMQRNLLYLWLVNLLENTVPQMLFPFRVLVEISPVFLSITLEPIFIGHCGLRFEPKLSFSYLPLPLVFPIRLQASNKCMAAKVIAQQHSQSKNSAGFEIFGL